MKMQKTPKKAEIDLNGLLGGDVFTSFKLLIEAGWCVSFETSTDGIWARANRCINGEAEQFVASDWDWVEATNKLAKEVMAR